MTGYFTTEAIVLGSIDYGESDRIVTFYTLEFGKLKGIAKGAKRSKKRFVNNLEPFSHIRLLFFQKQGRDLVMLEQADVVGRFDNLLFDIHKLAFGSYCLELLSEMTPEYQKNEKVFELLLKFLIMLDRGTNIKTAVRIFEMRLLSILGYHPHLDVCVVCKNNVMAEAGAHAHAPLPDTKLFFSSARSGILCPRCNGREKSLIPVSQGTIKFLMLAAKSALDKMDRIAMPDWAAEESERIIGDFIRYQLGKELKSKRFLNKIQAMGEGR
ncbi:MAG: DNA repair protein RecO [Deltaproteobacteria bacterium]|nr:DNA repair protein RecO [Deltaproteobacteria bacterium]